MLLLISVLLFRQVHSYINATGVSSGHDAVTGQWPMRQEITEFSQSKEMWDLYIQALIRFQNASSDDPLSYYQIAGIHGYPRGPWDSVGGSGDAGFCMHRSVLFPLWHRPYLALYEHAYDIAHQYSSEQQGTYIEAARALRIPYWDWVVNFRLPAVMTEQLIEVNTPSGPQTVDNPIYQYDFPFDMSMGDRFPTFNGSENLIKLTHTVKHYNEQLGSSDLPGVSAELAASSTTRLQKVYGLLVSDISWSSFATISNGYADLESIHGSIHNSLGGITNTSGVLRADGHMTVTEFSAFDPSFWLHHANVDRLTAIWQVLHNDVYVKPTMNNVGSYYQPEYTTDTQETPLAPFHSAADTNAMWTAATVRNISTFGYTYPELLNPGNDNTSYRSRVIERINMLYNPDASRPANSTQHSLSNREINLAQTMSNIQTDTALRLGVNNLEAQWYLRVRTNDRVASSRATIFLFVGEAPTGSTEWSRARNLVGSHTPMYNVRPEEELLVEYIDVPCTHTIAAAVDRGVLRSVSSDAAVMFLKSYITAKIIYPAVTEIDDLSVQISIISRRLQPRENLTEVPSYGMFEEHDQLQHLDVVFA